MARLRLRKILSAVCAFVPLVLFQNCGTVMRSHQDHSLGGGTDGKTYQNYATCANNQVGLSGTVVFSDDGQSALMTRQNCLPLQKPMVIDPNTLIKSMHDTSVFAMNGNVFDQQATSGEQKVTVKFCKSSAAQVLIWQVSGHASGLSGLVTLANGTGTGPLLTLSPTASEFVSADDQMSQFDLKLGSGNTASLTYAINGGATQSLSNLSCATQSPPPPPTSVTAPSVGSITNGGQLTLSDVGPAAIGIASFKTNTGGEMYDDGVGDFGQQIAGSATYDGIVVNGPHILIQGKSFSGTLDIYTSQTVVIRGCTFRFADDSWSIGIRPSAGKVYVLYSDLGGASAALGGNYGIMDMHGGAIAYRNHVSKVWTAFSASDGGLIVENYIDDFSGSNGNGVMINGVANFQVLRNKILLNIPATCALCLYDDYGPDSEITSDSNYLAGGGYTVYGGAAGTKISSTNVVFTNNIFGLDFGANVGHFGPLTSWVSTAGSGNVWMGNTYSDSTPFVNYPGGGPIPTN